MNLEKVKSIVSDKSSTVERINNLLLSESTSPSTKSPGHRPSSLGSPCLRKIYYEYFRITPDFPFDIKTLRIFETGNYYEAMVLSWLKKLGEHISYRLPDGSIPIDFRTNQPDPQFLIYSPRWRIKKGKIDNVGVVDGKLWIYEIKSMKSTKFAKLEAPLPEHLIQVAIYFQTFNDLLIAGEYNHIPEVTGKGKAEGVKILYISKDDSQIKEFILGTPALNQMVLDVDKKIMVVNQFIDKKTLPPKTKNFCDFCSFRTRCSKNENIE